MWVFRPYENKSTNGSKMVEKETKELAEERTEKAQARTNWAEDRTLLANERTFSSRIGLVLGCLGLAIGLQGVFKAVEPTWIAKIVATLFVIVAIFVALASFRNSKKMLDRLNSHSAEPASSRGLLLVSSICATGSIGVLAIIWMS